MTAVWACWFITRSCFNFNLRVTAYAVNIKPCPRLRDFRKAEVSRPLHFADAVRNFASQNRYVGTLAHCAKLI